MTERLAKAEFDKIVTKVLEGSSLFTKLKEDYRASINRKIHILDISEDSLKVNLPSNPSDEDLQTYKECYKKFITAVSNRAVIIKSLKDITKEPGDTPLLVQNPPLLISRNFRNARIYITAISTELGLHNEYFGVSNRARDSASLIESGWKEFPDPEIPSIRVFRKRKRITFINSDDKEVTLVPGAGAGSPSYILRTRVLSVLELGHTYTGAAGRESPLGTSIEVAGTGGISFTKAASSGISFKYKDNAPIFDEAKGNIANIIAESLEELQKIQLECNYTYNNAVPANIKNLVRSRNIPAGYCILTLHMYTKNNEFSRKESKIYNELLKKLKTEVAATILKIPGSNTMEQDLIKGTQDLLLAEFGIHRSPLAPHSNVTGTKGLKSQSSKPIIDTGNVKLVAGKSPAPQMRSLTGQFTSLISLQNILNQSLASQIQKNMGTGERTDVLNYRTGRFAGSVNVERMSASREGMITAFYSYMQNPYRTFSMGGKQEYPKTRDPKLLISRSIREIAGERVANRMRAVLV